jgi:thioredoxin reductase (NADPH)
MAREPAQRCDVAVIGGGLAGLHAAARVAQLGTRCIAFAGAAPGGLLIAIESVQGLPEHPHGIAGYDLGPMAQEAALDAGATCLAEQATRIEPAAEGWRVTGEATVVEARAVVLAMGSRLRRLGVPGEERLAGRGVSHCASCDAPLLRGRAVAVVGGGDAACQEALTLAACASRVHLLVRGNAMRARAAWQERIAAQPKIALRFASAVDEILGEEAVRAVRLADGTTLGVDGVFVYAGLVPATELLHGLGLDAPALADDGRVRVSPALHTTVRGLLAAGTLRAGHDQQAASCIADGRAAAEAAHGFIQSGHWPAAPTAPTTAQSERTPA